MEEPGSSSGWCEGFGLGEGEEQAAGLGEGFGHEDAGHERIAGEVAGEVGCCGVEVEFGGDGCCGCEMDDPADEAEGGAVGQDSGEGLIDFFDRVHRGVVRAGGGYRWWCWFGGCIGLSPGWRGGRVFPDW